MKHKITGKLISLFAILILVFSNMSYAGDLAKDTVWTKRTDQLDGFSSLQFINNDAVIVAQASGYTIFYDAFNGDEIKRILGIGKPIFFNNENNFLRLNGGRKKVEIFDTQTYEIIGELESDSISVGTLEMSKDENLLIGVVTNGLRVWDMKTKKILRTKIFETDSFLTKIDIPNLIFIKGKILAFTVKYYRDEVKQEEYTTRKNILYDFETLDSIDNWGYKGYIFKVSPTGKYIAYGINGVEIFSLETGELVSNIKGLNSLVLTEIEFSNDESYVVTSSTSGDDLLAIWDVKTGKQLYEYARASTQCFAISKDNKYIIKESGSLLIKYKVTEQMTSVSENNNQSIVYPNPTSGKIEVQYSLTKPNIVNYEISNQSGQKIINQNLGYKNLGLNSDSIEVGNFPRGTYYLRVYSDFETINFKFIKE